MAYDYAARASADGIVYAEVIINPTHWAGWELGPLTDALAAGFERAESEGLASCHLLLSILRAQSGDEAEALVEWMGAARPRRVVGLSIDGDEARVGPHRTTVRVGVPAAPASSVSGARPTPGNRRAPTASATRSTCCTSTASTTASAPSTTRSSCAASPTSAVTLNVCLSSNLVHLYPDRSAHPFPALHAAGVPLTVNTDDPGYLGIDLTGEFEAVADLMRWGLDDLAGVSHRAVDAAFCSDEQRTSPPPDHRSRCDVAVERAIGGGTVTFTPFRPLTPFTPSASDQHWLETADELAAGFATTAAAYDESAEIPIANLEALHSAGLDLAVVPASFGGDGMSTVTFGNVLATIAKACPSTACIWLMHVGAAAGLIVMSEPDTSSFFLAELPRREALRQRAERADLGQPVPDAAPGGRPGARAGSA